MSESRYLNGYDNNTCLSCIDLHDDRRADKEGQNSNTMGSCFICGDSHYAGYSVDDNLQLMRVRIGMS